MDNRETEYRCCDVADPHACDHGDKHVCDENRPRPSSGFAKNKGGHELGNVVSRQRGGYGETSEEQYDDWRPHGRKDMACRVFGIEPTMWLLV